ncbi:MAG: tripartite tricarboxylate transporter TctB family protein [Desulfobacteraceae bacterium]|jgi:putative tricarboxylic transport membrane protein
MNIKREKMGALFILALSIAYGIYAFKIPLIFLSQGEALNARTMPYALSIAGIVLSLLIILLPSFDKEKALTVKSVLMGLDWRRTAWFIGLLIVYSLSMPWIGFVIASIGFMAGGVMILGERKFKVILLASIPLVVGLWFILTKVLGMYIAPGELFYLLGGSE